MSKIINNKKKWLHIDSTFFWNVAVKELAESQDRNHVPRKCRWSVLLYLESGRMTVGKEIEIPISRQ